MPKIIVEFSSSQIYGVLPAATLFIGVYSKMASLLERKALFYATCVPFFVFFFVFDALIYPNRHSIQPALSTVRSVLGLVASSSVDGGGGGGASAIFAKLLANWTSSVYYVIAEVYSSVSVGILFWQYANDVVSVDQARRFYPLFAQMSGVAPIVAGQYVVRYASRSKDFGESLKRVTRLITFSGVMICLFYGWSNAYIERTEAKAEAGVAANGVAGGGGSDASPAAQSKRGKEKKKKKAKMTMVESARFLASSEYLRLIATLVLGYGEGKKSFFFSPSPPLIVIQKGALCLSPNQEPHCPSS